MATPHPDFARFSAVCVQLANTDAKRCSRIGFRFAALKYGHSKDLLSGEGAKISGGRVNAVGTFPVIYTSGDRQTATAETFRNYDSFGFDKVRPMVFVGIKIQLAVLLDLCDRGIRRRLGVDLQNLAQPWWPVQESGREALTQAIGRAAYEAGFEAVMLPSSRHRDGINLNIFPEKLRGGSSVAVMAKKDLQQYLI